MPMTRTLTCLAALFAGLALASVATASDKAKEQRWAAQIVDQLIDGEAVWLETGDDRFLALHTTPSGTAHGAIVVIHGTGIHPNWQQVIYPLRVQLAERGWATLSIQMPILANEAESKDYLPLFPEVGPRIDAALAYLQATYGDAPRAVVSHSLGATMSSYHLSRSPGLQIRGWVAIGIGGNRANPETDVVAALGKISVPTLDLYGERDLQSVLEGAAARAAAAAHNPRYAQQVIPAAGHFFDGHDDVLVETVDAWLAENVARR